MRWARIAAAAVAIGGVCGAGCGSTEQAVPEVSPSKDGADFASEAPSAPTEQAPALPAEPAPPAIVATPAADQPARLDALRPYFSEAPLDGALAAYLTGDNAVAAAGFADFAERHPDDVRARPARLMALLSRHDAGRFKGLAEGFSALGAQWPELGPTTQLYAGLSYIGERRWADAQRVLATVPRASGVWARAHEMRARAMRQAGKPEEARMVLETLLEAAPDERPSAWDALAELRQELGDAAGARAARVELAIRFARQAEGRTAFRGLGDKPVLSRAQRLRLGRALAKAHAHRGTIAILEQVKPGHTGYCEAQYLIGRANDRLKRRSKAWRALSKALKCKKSAPEVYGDATFLGARNRLRAGDTKQAVALLSAHVSGFPNRTTVDDALLAWAQLERDRGDEKAADKLVDKAVSEHPDGDMVEQAAWDRVFPKIKDGAHAEALTLLDAAVAAIPIERRGRRGGQLAYWRGRMLLHLGRTEDAWAQWRQVLVDHPLSWYAVVAYSRLLGIDEARAETALAEVIAASEPERPVSEVVPAALWAEPRFRSAVELARLGLAKSAQRELRTVPVPADSDAAWRWSQVALYQIAGGWHYGQRLARREEPRFGAAWPVGDHRRVWRLANPKPFRDLVQTWSTTRGIDPHWVWAVAREESNFNPGVESWANAIGLMQIILPTAEFLARGTDIEPTRENLQKPAVALELSTKYLASLLESHQLIPLASAGYNAGGGAMRKWRRAFGSDELDLFVEKIPYREARNYARGVTASYARYMFVYTGEMLELPLTPPGAP